MQHRPDEHADCRIRDIVVTWMIPTFDRAAKGPMPPPHRHYVLDWTKTSKPQQDEILDILGVSLKIVPQHQPNFHITACTTSVGASQPDNRMLKFRHLFIEQHKDSAPVTIAARGDASVFTTVSLHREYFEDETGAEISIQDMTRIASGNPRAILLEAESILEIGPTCMLAPEKWDVAKANTLFSFMQVIRVVSNSEWAKVRSSFTLQKDGASGQENVVARTFPDVGSMSAVLTLFRQLYGKDDLMNKACGIYLQHSSNGVKKTWIQLCHKRFNSFTTGSTPPLGSIPVSRLFDIFLYSAGLVHAPASENETYRTQFSSLVAIHGREKIVMAINWAFWQTLGYATDAFHVIEQDYDAWLLAGTCVPPDMIDIFSLLKSTDTP
jgi:hypothetical protein